MTQFDPHCTLCDRLARHLEQIRKDYPDYHARPVPPFGDPDTALLIVGLAPGKHGANASGRPFTGDYAGILLYETLYAFGFSNKPESSHADDGLRLRRCRITNAVKCLPPENKPLPIEVNTCNRYLVEELNTLPVNSVVLALGRIAHNAILKAFGLVQSQYTFSHGGLHDLPGGLRLIDSYHCSRYNTQTGRLTEKMFQDIFSKILEIIDISN